MAMKKSTPPTPPNPNKMKINSALTILGQVTGSFKDGTMKRQAFTDAQLKELKGMIAKADAAKAKAAADAKKNAKIIKKQNAKPLRTGQGATKPVTPFDPPKKPIRIIRGLGGMRGGGNIGGGGGMNRTNR
jgi:LPS O-antigen subunit length determinant protein (WzzB/FepE family)